MIPTFGEINALDRSSKEAVAAVLRPGTEVGHKKRRRFPCSSIYTGKAGWGRRAEVPHPKEHRRVPLRLVKYRGLLQPLAKQPVRKHVYDQSISRGDVAWLWSLGYCAVKRPNSRIDLSVGWKLKDGDILLTSYTDLAILEGQKGEAGSVSPFSIC